MITVPVVHKCIVQYVYCFVFQNIPEFRSYRNPIVESPVIGAWWWQQPGDQWEGSGQYSQSLVIIFMNLLPQAFQLCCCVVYSLRNRHNFTEDVNGKVTLGCPESLFRFSIRCYRKTRMNFLANPIFNLQKITVIQRNIMTVTAWTVSWKIIFPLIPCLPFPLPLLWLWASYLPFKASSRKRGR